MYQFWSLLPMSVKIVMLILILFTTMSIVRLARVWLCLSGRSVRGVSPEDLIQGNLESSAVAKVALAGGVRRPDQHRRNVDPSDAKKLGAVVHAAQGRFTYLKNMYSADVASARRTSQLAMLLSVLIASSGAYPFYFGCANDSRLTGSYCMFEAGRLVLDAISVALSMAATLYAGANTVERKLAMREAEWKCFCSLIE
jgi:hypothetical protein